MRFSRVIYIEKDIKKGIKRKKIDFEEILSDNVLFKNGI